MTFWSGQTLAARANAERLIEPFDPAQIDCSAYELKVGGEAFVTRDKSDQASEISQGRTPGHLLPGPGASICIPSGQFAFLITAETVSVPNDAIGLISMKAGKKWQGLVNVSGFHVDPGWHNRLIFGVFNAGPATQVIKPGERLFLLFYANLDEVADEEYRYKGSYDFSHIPAKLMQGMSIAVPTVYKLNDSVRELREDVKGAQNRSNIALTLAIGAISIALAIFTRALFPALGQIEQPALSGAVATRTDAGAENTSKAAKQEAIIERETTAPPEDEERRLQQQQKDNKVPAKPVKP